ncbi:MAG: type II toxin-antitoxin system ParD family antitoxin [Beijerinckiaceae bacterium]|nr:type II toxin-antitoxin system ParD family antitoxin [Beijerinckiaceae bacterium]
MAGAVDLGERLEAFIATLVSEGRYPSRDNALRESVRLLEERERKLGELDAAIQEGIADADAGRVHSVDEVRALIRTRFSPPAISEAS